MFHFPLSSENLRPFGAKRSGQIYTYQYNRKSYFADEGMILVDDIPAKENMQVHEKVFCMSEADLYDKDLKIKEHFRWINRFYDCFDLNKALTIAKMFDLDINKNSDRYLKVTNPFLN